MAYTRENREDREKYPCHGSKECTASWTYDDWHCSGCHWKGMGTCDLKYGDDNLRTEAEALRTRLATPNVEVRRGPATEGETK